MTTETAISKNTKASKLRQLAENFGVSAFAGLLVAGAVTAWFESRLENSKEHASTLIKQKDQVDTSQNNIFMQLGLYTDRVLTSGDVSKKQELQSAIIAAQLQINRLRDELKEPDQDALTAYANELDNLQKQLRTVEAAKDLKPIYVSAQKILELHDKVAERVRKNLDISVF
jgi:hypothetical protein